VLRRSLEAAASLARAPDGVAATTRAAKLGGLLEAAARYHLLESSLQHISSGLLPFSRP
jgi:hypothetical protein